MQMAVNLGMKIEHRLKEKISLDTEAHLSLLLKKGMKPQSARPFITDKLMLHN
jgi:hypothetical protein